MVSLFSPKGERVDPNPLSNQDEDWLWMKRFQEGDGSAFERIFNKYKGLVINLAFRFLRNREAAEDIAQEVFLKIYGIKTRLEQRAKFSTWLYRVTVNASLNALKKEKPVLLSLNAPEHGDPSEPEALDHIASPKTAPFETLQAEELKNIMRVKIQTLPEKLKMVITLYQFEDLSYREIADILGITQKAVEKRLYHAKEHIRRRLFKLRDSL